jgi:hypothetical protein
VNVSQTIVSWISVSLANVSQPRASVN